MKISKTLKKAIKEDGKRSLTARKISKLKSSKEFNYLVDISKV
ncbi:MAG: hypothetical protein U9R13_01705 [Campylobacterota bacterium]|nr:hypothetical protein [Campylobacterota bacterium]